LALAKKQTQYKGSAEKEEYEPWVLHLWELHLAKEETLYHLFLKCNFAKACWTSIGLTSPRIANPEAAAVNLMQQLNVPFSMEIVILMNWSIWKTRNAWFFQNKAPTVQQCKIEFARELRLVMLRAKGRFDSTIPAWLQIWQ
jgi:hypothetical protein